MLEKKTFRVLMIYPEFPPSFWSFQEAVKLMKLKATMPPTGLVTVAAMLPSQFEVMPIVDLNVEPLLDDLLEKADVVMMTAMIVQKESLRVVIARVKAAGKTVVVGGPYATTYSEDVLAMGADHLVLNEAEQTLEPFVEDFLAGSADRIYDEKSVAGRSTVQLAVNGKPIITETPTPRWDLLKLHCYSSLAVQFSRGCPFDCEFCEIPPLFGSTSRTKTPEQMISEFEAVYATGWRGSIFIVDDNFIGNRRQVRKLLPVLIEWQKQHGYPFSFFTEGSLDLANKNMRDIREGMVAAGFNSVFGGIESTDPDVLNGMNKGQNGGDLYFKVACIQDSGLEVTAGFIVGNDKDAPTVFSDLFRFIQETGIVIAMAGLLTALRGTRLHRRLNSENRLRAESSGNNTHRFRFNFEPVLDETFLIEGYVNLLERLFEPKNYYARCWTLQRRKGKTTAGRINGSWIHATIVVFFRNIIKRPNWHFMKFMLLTLLTSPRNMPEAVTQAVKLEHFMSITKSAVSAHRYPQKAMTLVELFKERVSGLQGGVEERIRKTRVLERKYRLRALRWYRSLDPHFRSDAKLALVDTMRSIRTHAERIQSQWTGLSY